MSTWRYVEIFVASVLFRQDRTDTDHEKAAREPGQNVRRIRSVYNL